jgi:hypothetical protein
MDKSIYDFTIPIFARSLGGLKNVLQKASEHGIDESMLLNDRLAPDMYPLARQVQIACDNAKGAAARLSGTEAPKFEDTEKTIAELQARIDKTLAFLSTVTLESFAGASERKITMPYFPNRVFTGFEYVREFSVPNFFFHFVTAYALVRKNGIPISKADYINNPSFKDI